MSHMESRAMLMLYIFRIFMFIVLVKDFPILFVIPNPIHNVKDLRSAAIVVGELYYMKMKVIGSLESR